MPEKEDLKITLKGKEKEKKNYFSLGDQKIKIIKSYQLGLSDSYKVHVFIQKIFMNTYMCNHWECTGDQPSGIYYLVGEANNME